MEIPIEAFEKGLLVNYKKLYFMLLLLYYVPLSFVNEW
jgi:hypothetical protein